MNLPFIEYHFGTRHTTPPPEVQTLRQIHSNIIFKTCGAGFSRPNEHGEAGDRPPNDRPAGDALIENRPGMAIGIKTADCVPILLADPVRKAVAAIHAGWRGTAAAIVPAAIRAMTAEFGTNPQDLHAAIGPSIQSCCFEVGPEVAREFGVLTPHHVHLDLQAINAKQLEAAGVPRPNISLSPDCTKCQPDNYHSFRRDREAAGRMLSWIRIRPNHST